MRGLMAQQMTMMGTWYQSQQAKEDLAQARREKFFSSIAPSTSGGQKMEPRW
jgi:P-type conjugative transfer protein TrbJ